MPDKGGWNPGSHELAGLCCRFPNLRIRDAFFPGLPESREFGLCKERSPQAWVGDEGREDCLKAP